MLLKHVLCFARIMSTLCPNSCRQTARIGGGGQLPPCPPSRTPMHQCIWAPILTELYMCYKTHIEKTKMKVNARNNTIRKLANSKWGCKASTLRPSCIALCYSATEYACPVWAWSTHAHKLNPALHDCCRII